MRFLEILDRILTRVLIEVGRLPTVLSQKADYVVELISQYAERLSNFIAEASRIIGRSVRKITITLLKTTWQILRMLTMFLAPAYLWSFGNEILHFANNRVARACGWAFGGIGFALMVFMVLVFFASFSRGTLPEATADGASRSLRETKAVFVCFDLLCILIVMIWSIMDPSYEFYAGILSTTKDGLLIGLSASTWFMYMLSKAKFFFDDFLTHVFRH